MTGPVILDYSQKRMPTVTGDRSWYDIAPDAPDTSGRTVPAVGPARCCSPPHRMSCVCFASAKEVDVYAS
jgi:hypothetical protein